MTRKRRKDVAKRVKEIFRGARSRGGLRRGLSKHSYDQTLVDWYETEGLVIVGHDTPSNAQLRVLDYCIHNLKKSTMRRCGYDGEHVLTKTSVREILSKAVPISKCVSAQYNSAPSVMDEPVPDGS